MAKTLTIELTPAQAKALEYTLRVAADMAAEATLPSVRRDARTLAPIYAKLTKR